MTIYRWCIIELCRIIVIEWCTMEMYISVLTNVTLINSIKIFKKWKSQKSLVFKVKILHSMFPGTYLCVRILFRAENSAGQNVSSQLFFQRWQKKMRKNKKLQLLYMLQWLSSDNKEKLVGRNKLLGWCYLNKDRKVSLPIWQSFSKGFFFFISEELWPIQYFVFPEETYIIQWMIMPFCFNKIIWSLWDTAASILKKSSSCSFSNDCNGSSFVIRYYYHIFYFI